MPVDMLPARSDVRPDPRDPVTVRRAESWLVAAALLLGLERRDAAVYAKSAIGMLIAFRDRRSEGGL